MLRSGLFTQFVTNSLIVFFGQDLLVRSKLIHVQGFACNLGLSREKGKKNENILKKP